MHKLNVSSGPKKGPRCTSWDLPRQLDGLRDLVFSRFDGALQVGVSFSELFADIESLGEELDKTKLDDDVGVRSLLCELSFLTLSGKSVLT